MSAIEQVDWSALHQNMAPRLQRIARSELRSEHDAEDVVQETFLAAWRSRDTLRDARAINGWLCRVVRNVAISRRRRRKPEFCDPTRFDVQNPATVSPLDRAVLDEALRGLPRSHRLLLSLVSSGISLREFSAAEGISYAAAKTRCSRARAALRGALT